MQSQSTTQEALLIVADLTMHTPLAMFPRKWNLNLLREIYLPDLATAISSIPLALTDQNDELVWTGSPSGTYSAKLGFQNQAQHQ